MINKFKHQAIYNLYSLVKIINETKEGVITAKDQEGNEVSIDMTAVNTKATELENAEVNHKASGNQKLLDLGLTQAEATALTGYTPPTEV
jgi:flagellar capping protein FliD